MSEKRMCPNQFLAVEGAGPEASRWRGSGIVIGFSEAGGARTVSLCLSNLRTVLGPYRRRLDSG